MTEDVRARPNEADGYHSVEDLSHSHHHEDFVSTHGMDTILIAIVPTSVIAVLE